MVEWQACCVWKGKPLSCATGCLETRALLCSEQTTLSHHCTFTQGNVAMAPLYAMHLTTQQHSRQTAGGRRLRPVSATSECRGWPGLKTKTAHHYCVFWQALKVPLHRANKENRGWAQCSVTHERCCLGCERMTGGMACCNKCTN